MIRTDLLSTQQDFFEPLPQAAEMLATAVDISIKMNLRTKKNPTSSEAGLDPGRERVYGCSSLFFAGNLPFCWRSNATSQRRLSTFISKMIP